MFEEGGPTLRELLRQALSSTTDGYDMLAPKFDKTPFRTPDAVIEVALGAVGEVDAAADLCCGTGAALAALAPKTRVRLVGVDASAGMLEIAKRTLGPAMEGDRPRVELVQADLFATSFADELDLITCFGAFGHIPEEAEPRFVALVRRALRPGGRFVFVTTERPSALDPRALVARSFNVAMRVRNALVSPPFIMYYLTFMLPEVARLLRWQGFDVAISTPTFPAPFDGLRLVVATRR
jgi:SAM-dependent methyltransferase